MKRIIAVTLALGSLALGGCLPHNEPPKPPEVHVEICPPYCGGASTDEV